MWHAMRMAMLTPIFLSPPRHGQIGALDELLLFCLPIVIAIVVLAVASQRARQKQEKTRTRAQTVNHRDTEGTDKS